jgi:hypothetical protein
MNSIAIIGLRIISIYLIVTGINVIAGISAAITVMEPSLKESYSALQLLSVAIPLISGIIIWLISAPISKYVATHSNTDAIAINEVNLVAAGTFLIGLYLVFSTIPILFSVISQYRELEYAMDKTSVVSAIRLSSSKLVIGIMLMAGNKFFVRAYRWLRSAG